ncbi:MAG: hypothetical protein ACXVPN_03725 [Bacteroidia bacterium]
MRKLIISAGMLLVLYSCNNETKTVVETSRRIFPEYHYALDTVLKSPQGIVSGVELGQNVKFIPLAQQKSSVESSKDHIIYEQKIDSLTRYSINYSLENDTISEIEVLITSQSEDEGEKILNDLKRYYSAKYTAPVMDKGFFVFNCFDGKKKNFTITLTDNGGNSNSAIEMLIYREK